MSQLGEFFSAHHQRLNVLIELGVEGGRTGIRNPQQLDELLGALHQWRDAIAICGVELYEGVLQDETAIRTFLSHAVELAAKLASENLFDRNPAILSGAGSAWYDVVAEVFSAAKIGYPLEIVLRPGCYLTHDVGVYRQAQNQILTRNPIAKKMHSGLLPALQLWAYVQSIPEKEKAILTLGKRDAAFDSGLPTPSLHYRPGQAAPHECPSHWELTRMMDQHAYMKISEDDDLRVGDMIGLDISHPCLTFDKWRYLPVLDSNYQVVDLVQTFFSDRCLRHAHPAAQTVFQDHHVVRLTPIANTLASLAAGETTSSQLAEACLAAAVDPSGQGARTFTRVDPDAVLKRSRRDR